MSNTIAHADNLMKPSKACRLILHHVSPSFIISYFYAKPYKRWNSPVFLRKRERESMKLPIDKK